MKKLHHKNSVSKILDISDFHFLHYDQIRISWFHPNSHKIAPAANDTLTDHQKLGHQFSIAFNMTIFHNFSIQRAALLITHWHRSHHPSIRPSIHLWKSVCACCKFCARKTDACASFPQLILRLENLDDQFADRFRAIHMHVEMLAREHARAVCSL